MHLEVCGVGMEGRSAIDRALASPPVRPAAMGRASSDGITLQ
jgi:hypothetical protein